MNDTQNQSIHLLKLAFHTWSGVSHVKTTPSDPSYLRNLLSILLWIKSPCQWVIINSFFVTNHLVLYTPATTIAWASQPTAAAAAVVSIQSIIVLLMNKCANDIHEWLSICLCVCVCFWGLNVVVFFYKISNFYFFAPRNTNSVIVWLYFRPSVVGLCVCVCAVNVMAGRSSLFP